MITLVSHDRLQLPPSDPNYMNACWGKLASEILMQSWDVALEDLNKVREVIDANVSAQTMFTSLSAWGGGWGEACPTCLKKQVDFSNIKLLVGNLHEFKR